MIKEIYIKGKFKNGDGSAAYIVVESNEEVASGSKYLYKYFDICGKQFLCDQFNCEILAAICGVGRCSAEHTLNVYSNNKSVIKWLSVGEEPDARHELMEVYRRFAAGKDILVTYIPHFTKDESDNVWNVECERLAWAALQDRKP